MNYPTLFERPSQKCGSWISYLIRTLKGKNRFRDLNFTNYYIESTIFCLDKNNFFRESTL